MKEWHWNAKSYGGGWCHFLVGMFQSMNVTQSVDASGEA